MLFDRLRLEDVRNFGKLFPSTYIPWAEFPLLAVTLSIVYFILSRTVLLDENELPVPFTVPIPEQAKEGWKGQKLEEINIKVSRSSAIQCYAPATGQLLGHVNPVTADGIDRVVEKAREAQVQWAKTSWVQRKKVLRTMLRHILDNQETIARLACLDSGKTMVDASFGEILMTVEKLKWTIEHGEKALKPERRPTNFLMMYKYNEVRWEPLGVLAACVSWNYPFHNLLSPIISTLFSGSALLLHPSERTSFSAPYFTSLARASLAACNHSPQLVQLIPSWPAATAHLTSHPGISHITFIGSRPIAHLVAASAAKALIPLCLELGGKDPALVLDDVRDLDKVSSILLRGVFQSAGQNCIGIERIIALPKIYDRLLQHLEPRIRALGIGSALDEPGVDVGAMISDNSFARLETLIAGAVAQGARLLIGGRRYVHSRFPKGHYFQPTLLADVTPDMQVAREEVFAPICVLMRAQSVQEAIDVANSTPYALGASVFGANQVELEKVVRGVKAGMVSVNDFGAFYAVQLPFGGRGGSGYGRFAGVEGLRGISNVKSVCRDRWWGGTRIPRRLDYGWGGSGAFEDGRKWEFAKGIVGLGYGERVSERVGGLWRLWMNR